MVADSCLTLLNDGKAIENIAKLKMQDKGLWNKIKNIITGLVNKIKAAYKGVQPYSREGIILSEALGNLEKLQEMWTEALIDAGDAYSEAVSRSESAESAKAEGEEVIRFSLMNGRGLSENVDAVLNMSEEEARKNVEEGNFVSIMKETPSIILNNVNDAENLEIIIRFDAFYLATRKEGMIEGHYYTVDFENMLGAYIDGEYIVPVRFGLKHGKMGETTLYVLIDQEKIKAEVIKKAPSIIKLKPSSKDLLRYLPDDMLSASQKEIKWQGIAETIEYTNNTNDARYTKFISERKLDAAKLMVKTAAEANGYKLEYDGNINYYISEDGKSKKSAETITYDDNDNVIPISKRFDAQNEDEKYSVRDSYDEYSKQNANQIISSITYNALKFNEGSAGKIEGKAELADIIWRKLNTTDYQDREYAASELAEEVIKRVTVKADSPDKELYTDTIKAIKPYLHSFNLEGITAEIEHRFGKSAFLLYYSAADNRVTFIKDNRLTARYCSLRLVKNELYFIVSRLY